MKEEAEATDLAIDSIIEKLNEYREFIKENPKKVRLVYTQERPLEPVHRHEGGEPWGYIQIKPRIFSVIIVDDRDVGKFIPANIEEENQDV